MQCLVPATFIMRQKHRLKKILVRSINAVLGIMFEFP